MVKDCGDLVEFLDDLRILAVASGRICIFNTQDSD